MEEFVMPIEDEVKRLMAYGRLLVLMLSDPRIEEDVRLTYALLAQAIGGDN